MGFILCIKRDVPDHALGIGRHDVHGAEVCPFLCQQGCHLGEDARLVKERKADGQ